MAVQSCLITDNLRAWNGVGGSFGGGVPAGDVGGMGELVAELLRG